MSRRAAKAAAAEDVGRDRARRGKREKNRFDNIFFFALRRRPRTIVAPAGRLFLKTRPPPPVERRPPITVTAVAAAAGLHD